MTKTFDEQPYPCAHLALQASSFSIILSASAALLAVKDAGAVLRPCLGAYVALLCTDWDPQAERQPTVWPYASQLFLWWWLHDCLELIKLDIRAEC